MNIHILGPNGTYTHEAASMIFGGSQLFCFQSRNPETIKALENDPDYNSVAIVPIENSTSGFVEETMGYWKKIINQTESGICKIDKVWVSGEYGLPIIHSLAVNGEIPKVINRIFSHPQALSQCTEGISKIEESQKSKIELVPTSSTAAAASFVKEKGETGDAAICSVFCVREYGLTTIKESFNDEEGNLTRFHILSKKNISLMGEANKTALLFYLRDEPQAQANADWSISAGRTNITTAHSVSVGDPGVYAFYREFETGLGSDEGQRIMQRLQTFTLKILVLGSFASHPSINGVTK